MKNTTKTYVLSSILLLFGILKVLVLDKVLDATTSNNIIIIFWILLSISSLLILKFPKEKSYYNKMSLKIITILLLFTLLVAYLIGFFTGFVKNSYSFTIINIIKNTLPVIIIIISKEIIRYIVAKNSELNKRPIILFTIVTIIFEIAINIPNFSNFETVFMFICTTVIPVIANEILCSYLTYNFGMSSSLLYSIPLNIYIYLLPIIPLLGDYITSVMFIFLPYMIYVFDSRVAKYNSKENSISNKKTFTYMFTIVILIFLVAIVILVTGIFKYKMIAIASDSMNPVFKRGDAVIYLKVNNINDVEVNDILVFEKNNIIVTHRIKSISEENGKLIIKTKGDNNENVDAFDVYEDDILGVIKYVISYIGYPTVWLNENFRGA